VYAYNSILRTYISLLLHDIQCAILDSAPPPKKTPGTAQPRRRIKMCVFTKSSCRAPSRIPPRSLTVPVYVLYARIIIIPRFISHKIILFTRILYYINNVTVPPRFVCSPYLAAATAFGGCFHNPATPPGRLYTYVRQFLSDVPNITSNAIHTLYCYYYVTALFFALRTTHERELFSHVILNIYYV